MIQGLGFWVIYRAKVHPDKEARYITAWSALTALIRQHRGGLLAPAQRQRWHLVCLRAMAECNRTGPGVLIALRGPCRAVGDG